MHTMNYSQPRELVAVVRHFLEMRSMDAVGQHIERFRRALVWRLALLHSRGVDLLPAAQAPMPRHEVTVAPDRFEETDN